MAALAGRAKQIDRIYQLLAETFLTRTTAEWLALLGELNIPAAPLRTTDELFDDPHLNAVGFFEEVDSPEGKIRFPGVPTWFSKTPGKVAGPTARLGQDTAAVLGELKIPG